MPLKPYVIKHIRQSAAGARFLDDIHYRTLVKSVCNLILNFIFAFYNGILGLLAPSIIFGVSAVYYLILSLMRFSAVITARRRKKSADIISSLFIGTMLMLLSVIFTITVFLSMKHRTAAVYQTIPMITIATYTFTKISVAAVSAYKRRRIKSASPLWRAIERIRYSEIAVSLLTMQQSMLVTFGEGFSEADTVLNACTGAAVCVFIFTLGVITVNNTVKEKKKWQNQSLLKQIKK